MEVVGAKNAFMDAIPKISAWLSNRTLHFDIQRGCIQYIKNNENLAKLQYSFTLISTTQTELIERAGWGL